MSGNGLIEQVIALEAEAARIVQDAQNEAHRLEEQAAAQIEQLRTESRADLDARLAVCRNNAELEHTQALERMQAAVDAEISAVEAVGDGVIKSEAERVLAALSQ